jgi:hypothetical protein
MEQVLQFLKDLLTDRIDNVKEQALDLYVELKTVKPEEVMILSFPFPSAYKLHIMPGNYYAAKKLYLAGRKIEAIITIRSFSLLNGDKLLGCPGLKETKDFVEGHSW